MVVAPVAIAVAAIRQQSIPIIQGLLSRLPKSGDVWPEADRNLWLDLLAGTFKLICRDKSEGGGVPRRRPKGLVRQRRRR
jgi:hypothetical protein